MAGVLDFDLSPSWCGWCAGDGSRAPDAGAFLLPPLGGDLGALAVALVGEVLPLIEQYQPEEVGYEAPLLLRYDSLLDLRRIYGLGMVLEEHCIRRSIPCHEMDPKRIKGMMTGDAYAEKKHVAVAAESLGIILPPRPADGRLDAGDAAGAWMVHLADFNPSAASPWIAKLRGSLI